MAMARYSTQMQLGCYNSPYPGQGTMPMARYSTQMQLGCYNSPYPGQCTMQMNGYPQNLHFGNYNTSNPVSGNFLMAQGFTNERPCSCNASVFDQFGYCAACGGRNMHIPVAVIGNRNTINP